MGHLRQAAVSPGYKHSCELLAVEVGLAVGLEVPEDQLLLLGCTGDIEALDGAEEVLFADGGAGMDGSEVEDGVEGEVRVGTEDLSRVLELALGGAHFCQVFCYFL